MIRVALSALLITAISCGDDTGAAVPGAAGSGTRINLSGIFYEYQPGSDVSIGSVLVCLDPSSHCVQSDDSGRFVLEDLDPDTEVLLTFTRQGYVPTLFALVTPGWSSTLGSLFLTRNEDLETLEDKLRAAGRAGSDANTHTLPLFSFSAVGGMTSSVSVKVEPDPGTDPFYILDSGELAFEIAEGNTATFGEYSDVPPREDYDLVYAHSNGSCNYYSSALGGWPSKSGRDNATRIPVRDGFMTYATLEDCSLDLAAR